jgi:hypothetical protein
MAHPVNADPLQPEIRACASSSLPLEVDDGRPEIRSKGSPSESDTPAPRSTLECSEASPSDATDAPRKTKGEHADDGGGGDGSGDRAATPAAGRMPPPSLTLHEATFVSLWLPVPTAALLLLLLPAREPPPGEDEGNTAAIYGRAMATKMADNACRIVFAHDLRRRLRYDGLVQSDKDGRQCKACRIVLAHDLRRRLRYGLVQSGPTNASGGLCAENFAAPIFASPTPSRTNGSTMSRHAHLYTIGKLSTCPRIFPLLLKNWLWIIF